MGFLARVCCARPSLLRWGFVHGEPHRRVGALGPRSPPISPQMGFCVPTRSKHPRADEGLALRGGSGDAGGQSSWTKKNPSSCRNLNLLFSLCR